MAKIYFPILLISLILNVTCEAKKLDKTKQYPYVQCWGHIIGSLGVNYAGKLTSKDWGDVSVMTKQVWNAPNNSYLNKVWWKNMCNKKFKVSCGMSEGGCRALLCVDESACIN